MADRIFPNRIQEEALDSDLVFQGIDWDNFNERLAKAKSPKMDEKTKKMLQGLNETSDEDAKDLSEVPDALRPSVEKAQEKAKKDHKDKDHKDKDHKDKDHDDDDEESVEHDHDEDDDDDEDDGKKGPMKRRGPKSKKDKKSYAFNHPSQISAEAIEVALANGDQELANVILAVRHERRVRLAEKIERQIVAQNTQNVKLAQRKAYREQLVKISEMKDEEVEAMDKMCKHCSKKYAGESCDCSASIEAGYGKSDNSMRKAHQLSNSSKKAFAAKALAEGFPQEYIDAMLGTQTVVSNTLNEIKNVMASELNPSIKKAAVSSMIKVATLTNDDYKRLKDYWKNELGYAEAWVDELFTQEYDK